VLLTVATAVLDDTHGLVTAGVPDPVSCVVELTHTVKVPVIDGNAYTVTVALLLHPLLFVYVITLVPADMPVTNPELLTVATPGVPDTHGFDAAGVPDPVSCVVELTHTVNVPVIVGKAFTVTVAVLLHPAILV
jgi:hypothetical protein